MASYENYRSSLGHTKGLDQIHATNGHHTNGHTPIEDQEALHETLFPPIYQQPARKLSPNPQSGMSRFINAVLDENTRANKLTISRGFDLMKQFQTIDPDKDPVGWALGEAEKNKKDLEDGMLAREDGPSPLGGEIDLTMDYIDWVAHLFLMEKRETISKWERNIGIARDAVVWSLRMADLLANGVYDEETGEKRKNVLERGNERYSWLSSRKEIKFSYQTLKTIAMGLMGLNPELSKKLVHTSIALGLVRSIPTLTNPENVNNVKKAGKKIGSAIGKLVR